jgi:hypothetical protein
MKRSGRKPSARGGRLVVRLAEDLDAAAVGRAEVQQAFDQAGLAGAVDADQRRHSPARSCRFTPRSTLAAP